MRAKNYLDWIHELESKLAIRGISSDLVAVALAQDSLVQNIMELAGREVDGSERCKFPSQCHSSLSSPDHPH